MRDCKCVYLPSSGGGSVYNGATLSSLFMVAAKTIIWVVSTGKLAQAKIKSYIERVFRSYFHQSWKKVKNIQEHKK